jgi:hypothetical protein
VKAINYSLGGTKQGDERAKNIINALAPRFIKVERDLGVQVQLNLAAWGGRYTGAMGGFDFATPTQLHHYQRTFRKYLRDQAWLPKGEPRQDVDELIGSLYFQRSNGVREPFSFERLQHTWDFAQVKSSKGKVSLDLNLGDRVVKKAQSVDLGKGFMLGDPSKYQPVAHWVWLTRSTQEGSPGMLQLDAYAASRAPAVPAATTDATPATAVRGAAAATAEAASTTLDAQ